MQVGDIVVVSGTSFLSRLIQRLDRSEASHVGLVINTEPVLVLEALGRVKTNPLWQTIRDARGYWFLEALGLSRADRFRIVEAACWWSAADYGFAKLGLQCLDLVFRTRWFTRHLATSRHPICSFLVAEGYAAVGLDFGVSRLSVRPSDILEFAISHPAKYAVSVYEGGAF